MATIPMSGECRKTVRTEKLHRTEVQNSEQGAPSKSQRERHIVFLDIQKDRNLSWCVGCVNGYVYHTLEMVLIL